MCSSCGWCFFLTTPICHLDPLSNFTTGFWKGSAFPWQMMSYSWYVDGSSQSMVQMLHEIENGLLCWSSIKNVFNHILVSLHYLPALGLTTKLNWTCWTHSHLNTTGQIFSTGHYNLVVSDQSYTASLHTTVGFHRVAQEDRFDFYPCPWASGPMADIQIFFCMSSSFQRSRRSIENCSPTVDPNHFYEFWSSSCLA